jgi:hypothetical protein
MLTMATPPLKSEDDVRTKIVVPWLLENGFSLTEISLEFCFRIRLGKSIVRVEGGTTSRDVTEISPRTAENSAYGSRADVLVRNQEGNNLLIVEVKAPDEVLDNAARDQAISYARSLAEGNIAPYAVVTNGRNTRIFDSISRDEILDDDPKLSIACTNRNFRISPDDLSLRAEALEALISFSSTNLLAFCEAQTRYRMKPLLGEDINSDRKFIPKLFVDREDAKTHFLELLDNKKCRVILLIGHPPVMERLASRQPCLFYPAIGLNQSLLTEISDDFEWSFGGVPETHSLLIRRIGNVLRQSEKRLTIFIDGWNETNIQLARTIDAECRRLSSERIQIVISLTHTAATRLLRGAGGNPSFLADEAGIPSRGFDLIELDPETAANSDGWSCVHIRKYSQEERERAYEIYSSAYQVKIPTTHSKSSDPYVIGIAMKHCREKALPDTLDEPELLRQVINSKIARAVGLEKYNVLFCLRELAREMLQGDAPVSIEALARIWSFPLSEKLPDGFFESALLGKETDQFGMSSVDFYYGRERDYAIACIAQNWAKKLIDQADMSVEFSNAVRTSAGKDALRWFLRQPSHIRLIQKRDGDFPHYDNAEVRQTLLSSLCEFANTQAQPSEQLTRFASYCAMNDQDYLVRIEAVKLVALVTDDSDALASTLHDETSLYDFVETILGIGKEFPLQAETAGQVVLDALRSIHWDSADHDDEGTSEITNILEMLCEHADSNIRREANTCFGHLAPFAYAEHIANKIGLGSIRATSEHLNEFIEGITLAANGLADAYFGDMCPGSLEAICEDPDWQTAEYQKMVRVLSPIIAVFGNVAPTDLFLSILAALYPKLAEDEADEAYEVPYFVDTYTLPLPFDE